MIRKITTKDIQEILNSRFTEDGFLNLSNLPDPSEFKDMNRATNRIVNAIKNQEKIVLIGDYDVDGVVSTTIMKLFFNQIGVKLEWIIPNRFRDGYGLSKGIIPRILDYDLAITVDNGISAVEASNLCREYNIDLIITDHHLLPPILPKAYAIIDQKQPDCKFPYSEVCGAQIAWYLIASIKRALDISIDLKEYLELVAIAIIADMMPLKHINRAMVINGLKLLERSKKPSIRAFMELLDKTLLNSEDVAFQIAPILNSAGRIDDAKYAVEFLISSNMYDARRRLKRLISYNEERKDIERRITQEAIAEVDPKDRVIVISGENWHEGVLGIVASRVAREYKKPTIILTKSQHNDLKGSGRSFHECNLFHITKNSKSLLNRFGGHHSAIGLSLPIENLEKFRNELQLSYMAQNYNENLVDPDILGELEFRYIDFNLINIIKKYEPYGQANSRPKFITKDISIRDVKSIGKDREHRSFIFFKDGVTIRGIFFRTKREFNIGDRVDIIYTINENLFNGTTTIQLMVEELIY